MLQKVEIDLSDSWSFPMLQLHKSKPWCSRTPQSPPKRAIKSVRPIQWLTFPSRKRPSFQFASSSGFQHESLSCKSQNRFASGNDSALSLLLQWAPSLCKWIGPVLYSKWTESSSNWNASLCLVALRAQSLFAISPSIPLWLLRGLAIPNLGVLHRTFLLPHLLKEQLVQKRF